MSTPGKMLALFAAGLVTLAGTLSLALTRPTTPPPAPEVYGPVPAFALTDHLGKPATNADYAGTVWVASFVFTRCTGPCPAVTATVARLQSEITDPRVKFVTFTVDPARDDPKELAAYAGKYRADPSRWRFLTGPEPAIHALMHDGFKLAVAKKPNADIGDEFDHSTKLAVVDPAGTIRGFFDGFPPPRGEAAGFEDNLTRLKARVAGLLR